MLRIWRIRDRELESDSCAAALRVTGRHPTAVALDHLLDDGEAEPGAGRGLGVGASVEPIEEPLGVGGPESGTMIADLDPRALHA